MRQRIPVTRTEQGTILGPPLGHPERTALLEGAGALLLWDVAADQALPTAILWDRDRALQWMWQIYGDDAVPAVLEGRDAFDAAPGLAAEPAQTAARASWASAWWPASAIAAIPPLDPRLVALERAVALVDVEHLLDDPSAADAALAEGLRASAGLFGPAELLGIPGTPDAVGAAAGSMPEAVRGDVEALGERMRAAAEDRGIAPVPADGDGALPRRIDYALAAGAPGSPAEIVGDVLAQGADPIDLGRFAPGTVDAAGQAGWRIVSTVSGTVLEASVERAPIHPFDRDEPAPLAASFAGIELRLEPGPARFSAVAPVATAVLLARPEERRLLVHAPGYADRDLRPGRGAAPWELESGCDAAALIDLARAAMERAREGADRSPDEARSLLAEREAVLRR